MSVLALKKLILNNSFHKHKKFFLPFFLIVFFTLFSSFQKITWLDKDLNKTSQNNAIYYTLNSKFDGYVSIFYKNRTLYRKVYYDDGKIDGKFLEYYKTGELRETGFYENGLRKGNWKEFYKNGKIKKKGKYNNGEKVGVWKTFYKNVY